MQPGLHAAVDIRQRPGKDRGIGKFHMAGSLAVTADQPVKVLDCPRDPLQGVGFHLAEIDDGVCLPHFPDKMKLLRRHAVGEGRQHLVGHIRHLRTVAVLRRKAQPLRRPLAGAVSRGIPVKHMGIALLLKQPEHSPHNRRVGGGRLVRVRRQQEIGFYQNTLFGLYKSADPSQKFHTLPQSAINLLLIIGIAGHHRHY